MKKALRETQTLRAGRSNAEPKIFAPPQIPFPGAHDGQSAGEGHYLHLQTKFGENLCTQFRVIVVTDTARPPSARHRQDRLQYTAPLCLARSVITVIGLKKAGFDTILALDR